MSVKSVANSSTDGVSEIGGAWITGAESRRILEWDNINSVRNAAQQRGCFRWKKKPNGHLVYWAPDVREYAARQAGKVAASGISEAA